jgi:hypothetical protein
MNHFILLEQLFKAVGEPLPLVFYAVASSFSSSLERRM